MFHVEHLTHFIYLLSRELTIKYYYIMAIKIFENAVKSVIGEMELNKLYEGYKIYEIYKHHSLIWKIIQKPFDDFYTSRQLLKILRYEHIDVLHVHLELLKFVLLIRRKIEHIKIIFTSNELNINF